MEVCLALAAAKHLQRQARFADADKDWQEAPGLASVHANIPCPYGGNEPLCMVVRRALGWKFKPGI
jgi:hypothetical protein